MCWDFCAEARKFFCFLKDVVCGLQGTTKWRQKKKKKQAGVPCWFENHIDILISFIQPPGPWYTGDKHSKGSPSTQGPGNTTHHQRTADTGRVQCVDACVDLHPLVWILVLIQAMSPEGWNCPADRDFREKRRSRGCKCSLVSKTVKPKCCHKTSKTKLVLSNWVNQNIEKEFRKPWL